MAGAGHELKEMLFCVITCAYVFWLLRFSFPR